jgi:hypothetical protein
MRASAQYAPPPVSFRFGLTTSPEAGMFDTFIWKVHRISRARRISDMRKFAILAILGLGVISTGCTYYVAPVMPPPGLIYSEIKAPLDTNAQSNPVGPRMGSSSTTSILGLVSWGDASVATAVQQGNLSSINHLDYEFLNIVFVYQKFTVNAYGE